MPREHGGGAWSGRADWDTRVLADPIVLDVPDVLPTRPDRLLHAAVAAMLAIAVGRPSAADRISELGRAGVVALRTSAGSVELRETRHGWRLVRAWGDPDARSLAAAARMRARQIARDRRQHGGDAG